MRFRTAELIGVAVAGAAIAWIVYAFDPSASHFFPRCMFHQLTGLQCPGCGGTRALHALLHGDLRTALRYNALFVAGTPLFTLGAATGQHRRAWFGWTCVVALIAWGVLRNIV